MAAAAPLPRFGVRDAGGPEANYIQATWRRSEKEAVGHLEGESFNPLQSGAMERILLRASTRALVVYDGSAPDTVHAWLVYRAKSADSRAVVYYLHTRPEMRRFGLAKLLLMSAGDLDSAERVLYTSKPARVRTDAGWQPSPIEKAIPRGWVYVPRAAFVEIP